MDILAICNGFLFIIQAILKAPINHDLLLNNVVAIVSLVIVLIIPKIRKVFLLDEKKDKILLHITWVFIVINCIAVTLGIYRLFID